MEDQSREKQTELHTPTQLHHNENKHTEDNYGLYSIKMAGNWNFHQLHAILRKKSPEVSIQGSEETATPTQPRKETSNNSSLWNINTVHSLRNKMKGTSHINAIFEIILITQYIFQRRIKHPHFGILAMMNFS